MGRTDQRAGSRFRFGVASIPDGCATSRTATGGWPGTFCRSAQPRRGPHDGHRTVDQHHARAVPAPLPAGPRGQRRGGRRRRAAHGLRHAARGVPGAAAVHGRHLRRGHGAGVLQLAALHRCRRRRRERPPDPRRVHREDRDRGHLRRVDQRQRPVLREDHAAAHDRAAHRHRPVRRDRVAGGPAAARGLPAEVRQGQPDDGHGEPEPRAGAARPSTRTATTRCPGSPA